MDEKRTIHALIPPSGRHLHHSTVRKTRRFPEINFSSPHGNNAAWLSPTIPEVGTAHAIFQIGVDELLHVHGVIAPVL